MEKETEGKLNESGLINFVKINEIDNTVILDNPVSTGLICESNFNYFGKHYKFVKCDYPHYLYSGIAYIEFEDLEKTDIETLEWLAYDLRKLANEIILDEDDYEASYYALAVETAAWLENEPEFKSFDSDEIVDALLEVSQELGGYLDFNDNALLAALTA